MNPVLLLLVAAGGYFLYSKSKESYGGDATGYTAVQNPAWKASEYAEMDAYAQNAIASPGNVAAKFKLEKKGDLSGKTVDAFGFIEEVKVVDNVRLWRVTLSSTAPDVGIAKGTVFVLTDKQLF